jgi:hypothetical protein
MAYEMNDSEPSLYEVLGIRPPAPPALRAERRIPLVPVCPPIQLLSSRESVVVVADEPALPTEGLWTVANVIVYSQMSKSWIYDQVELGVLPCIRKGRAIRFDPQVIRDFFSAKQKRSRR